ncbi:MAG: hypothetical protein ACTSQV_02260, partial [Alphaproteobacteria bacterium]
LAVRFGTAITAGAAIAAGAMLHSPVVLSRLTALPTVHFHAPLTSSRHGGFHTAPDIRGH